MQPFPNAVPNGSVGRWERDARKLQIAPKRQSPASIQELPTCVRTAAQKPGLAQKQNTSCRFLTPGALSTTFAAKIRPCDLEVEQIMPTKITSIMSKI